VPFRRLLTAGLLTVAAVVLANVLLRVIAVRLLDVSASFAPLAWGAVLVASVVVVAIATVVFGLLHRLSRHPVRHFRMLALVFLLVSLGGPLSTRSEPGGSTMAVVVLVVMHIVSAVMTVGLLPTLARGR
jgi:hypothetical protein